MDMEVSDVLELGLSLVVVVVRSGFVDFVVDTRFLITSSLVDSDFCRIALHWLSLIPNQNDRKVHDSPNNFLVSIIKAINPTRLTTKLPKIPIFFAISNFALVDLI